ncbi:DNA cytosine methyltransferase [Brevibacillus panacihumi]|uniref:DNA cytosine methyltransferase n=1 Tax=Brevibacillus panacihumi TaxID=497735 RepID=UPI003D2398C1
MGLTFLDLFAGIGGFRLGMQLAGHTPVGWVEWDKFARKSYEAIHEPGEEWTAHDITRVTDDDIRQLGRERGSIQVICGGFPCQAFSVAGKRAGFNDTRGTLFFEIMRFASILRPRYLFLENVVGLLNHENGDTFETILRTMDEVGYDAEWDVLNSKNFGVPQNRERVFIIGHLRGTSTRKVFPLGESNERATQESSNGIVVLQKTHGATTTMKIGETGTLQAARLDKVPCIVHHGEIKLREDDLTTCLDANYYKGLDNHGARTGIAEIRPVLTPDREEKRQNGRRFKNPNEPMFTLTAQDKHGVAIKKIGHLESDTGQTGAVYAPDGIAPTQLKQHGNAVTKIMDDWRIRKLTPRECFRLQGFPDWAFDRASAVNTDSQLYKQAGNSVTVNVIHAIARQLY